MTAIIVVEEKRLDPYADWGLAYADDVRRLSLPTKAPGRPGTEYADRYLTVPPTSVPS